MGFATLLPGLMLPQSIFTVKPDSGYIFSTLALSTSALNGAKILGKGPYSIPPLRQARPQHSRQGGIAAFPKVKLSQYLAVSWEVAQSRASLSGYKTEGPFVGDAGVTNRQHEQQMRSLREEQQNQIATLQTQHRREIAHLNLELGSAKNQRQDVAQTFQDEYTVMTEIFMQPTANTNAEIRGLNVASEVLPECTSCMFLNQRLQNALESQKSSYLRISELLGEIQHREIQVIDISAALNLCENELEEERERHSSEISQLQSASQQDRAELRGFFSRLNTVMKERDDAREQLQKESMDKEYLQQEMEVAKNLAQSRLDMLNQAKTYGSALEEVIEEQLITLGGKDGALNAFPDYVHTTHTQIKSMREELSRKDTEILNVGEAISAANEKLRNMAAQMESKDQRISELEGEVNSLDDKLLKEEMDNSVAMVLLQEGKKIIGTAKHLEERVESLLAQNQSLQKVVSQRWQNIAPDLLNIIEMSNEAHTNKQATKETMVHDEGLEKLEDAAEQAKQAIEYIWNCYECKEKELAMAMEEIERLRDIVVERNEDELHDWECF